MRRHKALPPLPGAAPLASELPLPASEKPALVLIGGAVSVHSDEGGQVTRRATYRSQKRGGSTCSLGGGGGARSLSQGLALSGSKATLFKAKQELGTGSPSSGPHPNVWILDVSGVVTP